MKKEEEEKYGSLDDVEIGTIKDVVETKRSEDFCSTYSRFIIQAILSASIITFSFVVILKQPEKDNSVQYSMISSIVGYWLPSPSKPRHKTSSRRK